MRLPLFATLLLFSAQASATMCAHEADRSFDVDRAGLMALVAKNGSSDVRIRGIADIGRIEVRGRACASDPADLDRLTVEQRRDGDRLVLEVGRDTGMSFSLFGSHYAYLDLEIRVPLDLAVEVDNGSGDIDVRDVARLRYDGGSGDLEVENVAGELDIEVGSGDIEGSNVGPVRLRSISSGDVNLRKIGGDVTVGRVGSGDLDLRAISGGVEVDRIGSGDVTVDDVQGSVTVGRIGSGDLRATGVRGDLTVRSTGSGDVSHRDIGGNIDVPYSD
ncbi:DUF4097 family beta strand repeat-containing protein [Dokdonella sp.]|uniref:DUF4097 family beta strand repeat-containing protein n=1 Tax=Dokdonella sp. TaxID=2291710 RepID=UPI003C4F7A2C